MNTRCLSLAILISSWYASGFLSSTFLDVSLVSDTVQRGHSAEIQVKKFSPVTKDTRFQQILCGYIPESGIYVPLAKLLKTTNSFVKKTEPPVYKGRVIVRGNTTIIIENVQFSDEGTKFYCRLLYCNESQRKAMEILKCMKLKRVFVKPKALNITSTSFPNIPTLSVTVIKCIFTGNPRVNVTWNVGKKINGIKTVSYHGNSGLIRTVAIYNITEVPQSHINNYSITCVGENAYGKAMLTVTFTTKKETKPNHHHLAEGSPSISTWIPIVIAIAVIMLVIVVIIKAVIYCRNNIVKTDMQRTEKMNSRRITSISERFQEPAVGLSISSKGIPSVEPDNVLRRSSTPLDNLYETAGRTPLRVSKETMESARMSQSIQVI